MSSLDLNDYRANSQAITPPTAEQLPIFLRVRRIGTFAVILVIIGIIVPFVADIAALFLAKRAMTISRVNLVPYEYEKRAYWAYRISIVGILWWIVFTARFVI